jgi:hypothetical protein
LVIIILSIKDAGKLRCKKLTLTLIRDANMASNAQNQLNLLSIKPPLDIFETRIRAGLEHNNPPIVYIYLKQIQDLVSTEKNLSARFVIARRAFHLLYETIADKTIEVHWRELCLDNVNVPLHLMKNNLDSPQIRNQYRQIQYNLNSLCMRS